MISEISLHAKPSNKKAVRVVSALLISAAACIVAMLFMNRFTSIAGLVTFILVVAALFLYTKYISTEYIYDISTDRDGMPIFIVRNKIGKRETTLSRLDFTAIRRAERKTAEEMRAYRPEHGVFKYTYCPTLSPEEVILITVRSRYEKADVIIEAPDEFMDYINKLAKDAAMYSDDE